MINHLNFNAKGGLVKVETGENTKGPYANVRLAIEDKWTDAQGEKQTRTSYITVHCPKDWMVSKLDHAKPGNRINFEGFIKTSEYEDSSGQKRSGTDFYASDLEIIFDDRRHNHRAGS